MRLQRHFFLAFLSASILYADAQSGRDSVTATAGKFNTSRARQKWMGANYRTEWNTPVTVPVQNLAGLTPVKKGGGKQTKSLRMQDASGNQYTIRSIQKFITSKTLPGDLNSEAAADLVSEGVSASYPYASLSMQPLADAVGVPYGKVRLVYIPDDPALGEFRQEFGNMLATFEDRLPEGLSKGYDTDEVADKLEKDNDNNVDQKAMLTARILDMFVMDLDRHEDQWQWGARDNNMGGKTYFPIPRDRDQAFYINQGILPRMASRKAFVPQLEGFKPKAHNINRFNFAARNLDRFFLNGLTEQDWKSAAEDFVSKMTDEVIERALAMQPAPIRALPSNQHIIQTLKARRQHLVAEVMQYYYFVSETVTVTGSDKGDLFQIDRNSDGSSLLRVYRLGSNGEKKDLMYERLFDGKITKEIFLFGFDGNDRFVINGTEDKIKIRMIGGGGADVFEKKAKGKGSAFVYDKSNGENRLAGKFYNKLSNDKDINKFDRLGFKYKYTAPGIGIGFNPDDGLFLGLTQKIITHGFRKDPFKASHLFSATHALSTKAWNFRYDGEFTEALGKNTDIVTNIDIKAPNNTTNFFGYGMNSVYDKSQPEKFRYYRARYNLADVTLLIRERFSPNFTVSFGPSIQRYKMDSTEKNNNSRFITDIASNGLDPVTAFSTSMFFGGKLLMNLDLRDHPVIPSKGLNWVTSIRHLSGLKDNPYSVTQMNSDFSFYLPLAQNKRLVLANRFGGATNVGKQGFEFYQAQYLGSEDNLRGFRRNRFAGKSKLYNQAELRLKLADFTTYLFPGSLGVFTFFDAGKVWEVNDPGDTKLAYGYGGGLWFSPLSRIMLTVTYAMSKEDKLALVSLGWRF